MLGAWIQVLGFMHLLNKQLKLNTAKVALWVQDPSIPSTPWALRVWSVDVAHQHLLGTQKCRSICLPRHRIRFCTLTRSRGSEEPWWP